VGGLGKYVTCHMSEFFVVVFAYCPNVMGVIENCYMQTYGQGQQTIKLFRHDGALGCRRFVFGSHTYDKIVH